ncbi:OLC1v1027484C1 [Oldenlandia corymbosa var. corymbosa]|uniref:OLC1v1027484C1 n=1 Tax=Oldenlandia corymbosa var. corymbosa TaxID=529605 RepID=A0AAV1CA67_OLDCO|nr:OLC1v1027484C1 [Oldenlandia corymbosa var. corymbosa]
MESAKVPSGVRKVKKKQVKDELDRIKQAEKKKRRLEKALATSAAIRSELEKKKQKKKEEQQRLDEEGAAIAEAVALHVLIGEDSDDSCNVMMKKDEGLNQWDCYGGFGIFMGGTEAVVPHDDLPGYSLKNIGWFSDNQKYGYMWSDWNNSDQMAPSEAFQREIYPQYLEGRGWESAGFSPSLIAQAVSSLQIAEDSQVDNYVFNHMLRG